MPDYHCAIAQKAVGLPCAPSTGMDAPLIQLARSDERNTTTSATSKSVPSRCAGNSRVRNIFVFFRRFVLEAFPTAAREKERARADGVDADVVGCQFPRERAREKYFTRFGCAVLRAPVRGFPTRDGRDGDNTATISFCHVGNGHTAGANRVKKVEVKGLLPVGVCGGEQFARSGCAAPRC